MTYPDPSDPANPSDPFQNRVWDVLVVGTGMGGSTLGLALARRGLSVLFLEKGRRLHHQPGPPEAQVFDRRDDPSARLARGHWPVPLTGETSDGTVDFYAPLGCGTGGSSTLYAAQLERMRPVDFEPNLVHGAVEGTNLPHRWPLSYEELGRFYAEAETLYQVCGTEDPLLPTAAALREPPALSPRDADLFDLLAGRGLHPYRAHVGCRYIEGCADCGGRLCKSACKADAAWTCLLPALRYDCRLLTDCEVTHVEADASAVTYVHCRHGDTEIRLRGRTVVLAAGAYRTPILLQRSRSKDWPQGLANRSGQVGRNLMCHVSDYFAIRPRRPLSMEGPFKSISLNDFYVHEGVKLGTVHNVGVPVTGGHVLSFLRDMERRHPAWWRTLARPFYRPIADLGAHYYRSAGLFAYDLEDLPYADNRIEVDDRTASGSRFYYTYRPELRERVQRFRRALVERVGRRHVKFFTSDIVLNYGHVCGTCRFGDSPADSVLDRNNKAHDLDNLYVVDASFFPTSGGINPSLTIAANALRVAEVIHAQIR